VARRTGVRGAVKNVEAEADPFTRRRLRRHAAFWSIWALGLGCHLGHPETEGNGRTHVDDLTEAGDEGQVLRE
jgi:hypothetical protein